MIDQHETLSQVVVKGINYGTEEWVKQLLILAFPDKKTQVLNPYIGVLYYPSNQFLTTTNAYQKAIQFAQSHYVGYMDMLLPPVDNLTSPLLTYTLLQFTLDGVQRQVIQVSGGANLSQDVSFKSYILSLFPNANNDIAFIRDCMHILSDINISGAAYEANSGDGDPFTVSNSGAGAFTPSISFQFNISGFKCLVQ